MGAVSKPGFKNWQTRSQVNDDGDRDSTKVLIVY